MARKSIQDYLSQPSRRGPARARPILDLLLFRAAPLVILAWVTGCRVDLDVPPREDTPDEVARVDFDPAPAEDGAVAAVVHVAITPPEADRLDAADLVLVAGDLSEVQLRYLQDGRLTRAVQERVVPFDAFQRGGAWVVAPNQALVPGPFAVAVVGGDVLARFSVADAGPATLQRVFPPAGVSSSAGALVYCGDAPITSSARLAFMPAGPAGRLVPLADGCARFVVDVPAALEPPRSRFVAPVRVWFDAEGERALDPAPLVLGDVASVPGLGCDGTEQPLAAGCALVQDDRVRVRVPSDARLWSIQIVGADGTIAASTTRVAGGDASDTFELRGLTSSTSYMMRARAIDLGGTELETSCVVTTSAPVDHLILSEVLANPLGAEPAQEWIEIQNDGGQAVSLDGYTLADAGASFSLPALVLAPGDRALVVNESFDEADGADPSPARDCSIVRVPKLGKNGLSNEGERITLSRDDVEVSFMPATPKPAAGKSVARAGGAIVVASPTPCAPPAETPEATWTNDGPDPRGPSP